MKGMSRSPPAVIMTLRFWQEALGNEQSEWRGEIKNLTTGEVRYFRQWEEIVRIVPRMLSDAERTHNETDNETNNETNNWPHEEP